MTRAWVTGISLAILLTACATAAPPSIPRPQTYSQQEARLAARMLADFYRISLQETHNTFVEDGKPPAATVLKRLFTEMERKGWIQARWLSVNNNPANPLNLPRDAFEKEASRALRHGTTLFEKVERSRYRAAAAVPFNGTCLKCHWGDKPNEYLGGISFSALLRK